jgi:hypothetical protein
MYTFNHALKSTSCAAPIFQTCVSESFKLNRETERRSGKGDTELK